MATIYVDPSLSPGTGTGTLANPYQSWITPGVSWVAGNTYLLKRGTLCTEQIAVTPGAFPPSRYNRITIGAYGTGARPIVSPVSLTAISTSSRSGITIKGIHAIGGNVAESAGIAGFTASALTDQYITIDDCVIEAPIGPAVVGGVGSGSGVHMTGRGNIISNTEFKNCFTDAIFLTASDTVINNCYIHDFDLEVSVGDGIQFAGTHNHGATNITNTTIVGHMNNPVKQCLITAPGSTADKFIVSNCNFSGMKQVVVIGTAGAKFIGCKFSNGYTVGVSPDFSSCITVSAANVTLTGCALIAGVSTYRAISVNGVNGAILQNCTISSGFLNTAINSTSGTVTITGTLRLS
jgi:hypothetical protein